MHVINERSRIRDMIERGCKFPRGYGSRKRKALWKALDPETATAADVQAVCAELGNPELDWNYSRCSVCNAELHDEQPRHHTVIAIDVQIPNDYDDYDTITLCQSHLAQAIMMLPAERHLSTPPPSDGA